MRRLDDHRHGFAAMMRFARAASAAIDAALVLAVAPSARAQRRQGLADYLALQVHPGAGVGPNADGDDRRMTIPEVAECLGTSKAPRAWLGSDIDLRRAYYFASYRFVGALIEQAGVTAFLRLYDSDSTESEL
ncbi:MAG: hypothetical protein DMD85_21155, partial [Candidatus Rokuibacteriota bacterium]